MSRNYFIIIILIFSKSLFGYTCRVSNTTDKIVYISFTSDDLAQTAVDRDPLAARSCKSYTISRAYTVDASLYNNVNLSAITRYVGLQNRNVIIYQLPNSNSLHIYDY